MALSLVLYVFFKVQSRIGMINLTEIEQFKHNTKLA